MKVEDIKLYYAYNEWANKRILDAAERVSPEQLTAENDLGWGTLRGALVHILDAEYGWFDFLFAADDAPDDIYPENFADIDALRKRWRRENENLWRCLDTLNDKDLTRVYTRKAGRPRIHCCSVASAGPRRQSRYPAPQRMRRPAHRLRTFSRRYGFHFVLEHPRKQLLNQPS